jgi:lysophospholipase L1-like esterase
MTMAHDAGVTGAQVVLCTLPPQRAGGSRAADAAAIGSYNQAIRDIARSEGAMLVDFAAAMTELNAIGADGLHPTEAGYARMAEILFNVLRASFEVSSAPGARPLLPW